MKTIWIVLFSLLGIVMIHGEEYVHVMRMENTDYRVTTRISQEDVDGNRMMEKADPITGSVHRIVLDQQGKTKSWNIVSRDHDVLFSREGARIIVYEESSDHACQETIEIDEKPWFAAIPEGLHQFVVEGGKTIEFWTINPQTFKAYRMIAKRVKTEDIIVQGRKVRAIHIKVSASGVPALFFSMSFWYRESDEVPGFQREFTRRRTAMTPRYLRCMICRGACVPPGNGARISLMDVFTGYAVHRVRDC